ncbi:hypothetical protein DsansV1_C31g0217271 [Dioscorea sansibarensis]
MKKIWGVECLDYFLREKIRQRQRGEIWERRSTYKDPGDERYKHRKTKHD